MWVVDDITNKWVKKIDSLVKSEFDFLKQELKTLRFYQKCLSGSTYVGITDLENIYDILQNTSYKTINYWSTFLPYTEPYYGVVTDEFQVVGSQSFNEIHNKYLPEYGLTLKNLFTPTRLIKDQVKNLFYVDLTTTESITDLNANLPDLFIDGIKVLEGHKILIKDQYDTITISSSIDPDVYFDGYYVAMETIGTQTTYKIPSYSNGLYKYQNYRLVRQTDLDTYENCIKYSVCVRLGVVNSEKQFKLQRLRNGYFPEYLNSETIYFEETHNYVLRNRIDYNNLYELSLQDTVKYATQSLLVDTITYSIPERTISVGEFGSIIVSQDGYSNIIDNKYKNKIRSIDETTRNYWVCGDDGLVLKIYKEDLRIEKISLDYNNYKALNKLNSISFYDDLRGVIVGDFNEIWYTFDGGYSWKNLIVKDFEGFNYNKVIFTSNSKFYVGGDAGVFIEFTYSSGNWTAYKRRVSKYVSTNDEFILVDDINDMYYFVDDSGNTSGGEFISIACNNNQIYLYDISKSFSNYDFIFVGNNNTFGDVTSVIYTGTPSNNIFISNYSNVFKTEPFSATFGSSQSNILFCTFSSYLTQSGINKIFNYNNDEIVLTGNNSIWEKSNIDTSSFSSIYNQEYFNKLRPRLLFMDYDIGSKLYWFDDYGQYRVPSRMVIPTSYLFGSSYSKIEFGPNIANVFEGSVTQSYYENNWITYWKDRLKTFRYSTQIDDSNKVEPSFVFEGSNYLGQSFTYSQTSLTINYSDIQNLMPVIDGSRFRGSSVFSAPSGNYDLYFYDFLGVWKLDISDSESVIPSIGDVLYLSSSVVEGKFIINQLFTQSSGSTVSYYQYFYTDFNNNITNNLSEITDVIEIYNLNKYPLTQSNSQDTFLDRFSKHYIGYSYDSIVETSDFTNPTASPIGLTESLIITGKYSQYSAYYNLQSNVLVTDYLINTFSSDMVYPQGFLNFGYSPTYNLLSYLNFLDPNTFIPSKEILSLPRYETIPGPDAYPSVTNDDLIYIDVTFSTNKLLFGKNLKFEFDSFLKWTFVDILLTEATVGIFPPTGITNTYATEGLIIIDKYYDETQDKYVMVFHDEIEGYNSSTNIVSIDVKTRRSLQQISDDLQYINRLQRPTIINTIETSLTFSSYESKINSKIPTDSYTKALLLDSSFIKELSGIIYTDYKNELALQVIKLENVTDYRVSTIISPNSKYQINFSSDHNLKDKDYLVLYTDGDYFPYTSILGYHNVSYLTPTEVEIDVDYIAPFTQSLYARVVIKDSFLNYQPIDIFDVGVGDKKIKQSIEILPENYVIDDNTYSLENIDFRKYRFRLVDGLDLDIINSKYPWILEAEISDAIIGMDILQNLIWYKGNWECGRWFGGRWVSGNWKSGDWYDGVWDSKNIQDNLLSVRIDNLTSNSQNSKWFGGRWFSGSWNDGIWYDGRWYGGTHSQGTWYNGTWNDGTWLDGSFLGGTWVLGYWYNGLLNSSNKKSYWLDGYFFGGDFQNGEWYDGVFDQKNSKISRFGTKASNSRNAIWYGGQFLKGQFHSFLNTDDDGNPSVSEKHKYSSYHSGFFGGDFWGGHAYNMNLNSGIWHGGILKDIEIIGVNATPSNTFLLDGIHRFNIGDEFYVVDNLVTTTYSNFGSTNNPKKYKVLDTTIDSVDSQTEIYVDYQLSNISSINTGVTATGLRLVSKFSNATWNSGIWYNGVFEGGSFNGGIWYNGVFSGIWG